MNLFLGLAEEVCEMFMQLNENALSIIVSAYPEIAETWNKEKFEHEVCGINHSFYVCGMKVASWSIGFTEKSVYLTVPELFATHEDVIKLLQSKRW